MRSNPLDRYRRLQRQIRAEFDAFTAAHCPTCPAPCCRKPARIGPVDILLAEAAGWKPPAAVQGDAAELAIRNAEPALLTDEPGDDEPCEYLTDKGCSFPNDLRPYGCTAYVCPIMYERMDRKRLGRIRRLARELDLVHQALLARIARTP
jgi:hypothetical protein